MKARKRRKRNAPISLISPENKLVKFESSTVARQKTGLSKRCMDDLMRGDHVCVWGWKSTHPKVRRKVKYVIDHYTLINLVTKEEVIARRRMLKDLDEKYNVRHRTVQHLIDGRYILHKNWIIKKTYDLIYGKLDLRPRIDPNLL